MNPNELDNEALAFKPVLGPMLSRIYHNPQNEENQPRLQKILQFWASKEVFDQDTIYALEGEMKGGPQTNVFTGPSREAADSLTSAGNFISKCSHMKGRKRLGLKSRCQEQ